MRKLFLSTLAVVLLFVTSAARAESSCPETPSPRIARVIEALRGEAKLPSYWNGYQASLQPILLLDNAQSRRCIWIIAQGQVKKTVSFSKDWPSSSGGFAFLINPKTYPKYPGLRENDDIVDGTIMCCQLVRNEMKELGQILESLGFSSAYLHWFPQIEPPNFDVFMARQFSTIVHEGFHFFYQNRQLSKAPWPNPELRSGVTIDYLLKNCYSYSNDASHQVVSEIQALMAAYQNRADHSLLKKYAKAFIAIREARYRAAPPLPKPKPKPRYSTCELLEAQHEFAEGTAQFVGDTTSSKLGYLKTENVLETVQSSFTSNGPTPTAYYFTGSLQLALLEELLGDEFQDLTTTLSTASTPTPLWTVLKSHLN